MAQLRDLAQLFLVEEGRKLPFMLNRRTQMVGGDQSVLTFSAFLLTNFKMEFKK